MIILCPGQIFLVRTHISEKNFLIEGDLKITQPQIVAYC